MQTHISAQTIEVAEDPFKTVLYLEYNEEAWKHFKCIRTCFFFAIFPVQTFSFIYKHIIYNLYHFLTCNKAPLSLLLSQSDTMVDPSCCANGVTTDDFTKSTASMMAGKCHNPAILLTMKDQVSSKKKSFDCCI